MNIVKESWLELLEIEKIKKEKRRNDGSLEEDLGCKRREDSERKDEKD